MGELDLPQLRKLIGQFTYLIQAHIDADSESSRLVLASAVSQFGEVVNALRQSLPDYQRAKNKRELKLEAKRQLGRVVKEVSRSPVGQTFNRPLTCRRVSPRCSAGSTPHTEFNIMAIMRTKPLIILWF